MNEAIDDFSYGNRLLSAKTHFSLIARKKMYRLFLSMLQPDPKDEILDLGTTPDMRLADSNLFDKLYPYKDHLSVCSVEDCSELAETLGLKQCFRNESHRPLPFDDRQFDICFCSAVLEHVGDRENQEQFLNECLRIARKVFITTPYRYFPLEVHTFLPFVHWLPQPVFQAITKRLQGEFWASTENLNLCSMRDIRRMKLTRAVEIRFIRTAGMRSNMVLIAR